MRSYALISALFLIACGPSAGSGNGNGNGTGDGDGGPGGTGVDGGITPPPGNTATVSGTVWAPGQAPGMVPNGQEIPVHNALVYVTPTRPAGIPQQTFCEKCVEAPGKSAFTDHKGNFSLDRIVAGNYFVVIQKGQFRYERQITLAENEVLQLSDEDTTLPSVHDPDNGKWIPRIAMAVGDYDKLEDILGKMGLGGVDTSGRYLGGSAPQQVDVYDNGGSYSGNKAGSLTDLVSDINKMLQYHIIFIPCASTSNTSALNNQQNLKNIRNYVDQGGKLYVTDWSGEWMDNVFPEQITLGDSGTDTPASAYNAANNSWNTGQFGDADGSPYESDDGEAANMDLFTWLDGQQGPTALSASVSTYSAGNFVVEGNWNWVSALTQVQVGTDDEGLPLYDTPTAWVIGSGGGTAGKHPLTVTFEPTGCGRVLYSTYHTTDNTHVGLVPQERVLLYLLMEIGVCSDAPVID